MKKGLFKNLFKASVLSTALTIVAQASTDVETYNHSRVKANAQHLFEMRNPAAQENQWWNDYERSGKNIVTHVEEISKTNPAAAAWFLMTGGKYGFAKRTATQQEENQIINAMKTVAKCIASFQDSGGQSSWDTFKDRYKRDYATHMSHLDHMQRQIDELTRDRDQGLVRIAGLEKQIFGLEKQVDELKVENGILKVKVSNLEERLTKEKDERLASAVKYEADKLAFEERLENARKKHVEQDMVLLETKLKAEAEAQKAEYEAKILGLEVTRVTKELDRSLSKVSKIKTKNEALVEKLENLMKQQQLDQRALEEKSELEKKLEELTKREEKKVGKAGEYLKKYRDAQDQYASLKEKFDSEKEAYKALDTKYSEIVKQSEIFQEKYNKLTKHNQVLENNMLLMLAGDVRKAANNALMKGVEKITEEMNQKRAMNRMQEIRARSASPLNRSIQSYESSFTSSESSDSSNSSTFSFGKPSSRPLS